MTQDEKLKLYTSIKPNHRQKIVQNMKFYAFVHYTVNTFTDLEWGTGKESETVFNPLCQDTDQWCSAIKAAGMTGLILTCKHHDGFCLWQTKTTEHCIRNSPYKNGNGDVVKEVADSCRKYGLRFGVYLSPWDRNSEYYGTNKYNDFYISQLTELLTNYGDIFMLWLDGACDAAADGKPAQKYDFDRIWSTAYKLQPNICISDCAPDIRWVGNEGGISRKSEWNVVPTFNYGMQNIEANCSDDYEENQKHRCVDAMAKDLGSREFLDNFSEFEWYPAEVDVSIRDGWFWHESKNDTVKSLDHLMKIYYKAVGGNSLLLLNIPPDKRGLLHENDVKRLKEMGEEIEKMNSLMLNNTEISAITQSGEAYEFTLSFEKTNVDRIYFEEDTDFSQRIESFEIYNGENNKLLYSGTVVGFGNISIFEPVETSSLTVKITSCRLEPHILKTEVYKTGAYRLKDE